MLGHKWGEWEIIFPATCTEKGLRERKCIREPIKVYIHSSEIYKVLGQELQKVVLGDRSIEIAFQFIDDKVRQILTEN